MNATKLKSLLVINLFLLGCNQTVMKNQTVKIGPLSLNVPQGVQVIDAAGIDSHVKLFVLNKKDTLTADLGRHSFPLKEDIKPVISEKEKKDLEILSGRKIESNKVIISDEAEDEIRYGLFLKNYYSYDTINGIPIKLVKPKKVGDGITGVYASKLKDGNTFVIYGVNLDSLAQKEALDIIKSIKYK